MTPELPFITCLCPTFRRPTRLLNNAVACFLAQTYPENRRRLLILDDSGEIDEKSGGENWSVVSVKDRYESLPEKYHALVELAGEVDAYCVWEDDECFLPRHLEAHALALKSNPWSKPFSIYTLITKEPKMEEATGRFHSSMAFSREAYELTGGWPRTKMPNFDLQFIENLQSRFGSPGDPCEFFNPTYVFRWMTTNSYHGQNFMQGQNEDWWDKAGQNTDPQGFGRIITPEFDDETKLLYSLLGT